MSIFSRRQRVRHDPVDDFIHSICKHCWKTAIISYTIIGACVIGGLGLAAGLGYLAFKGVPLLSAMIGAAAGVSTIAGGGILFAGLAGAALVTTGLVFGIKAIVKAVKNKKKYKNYNRFTIEEDYKTEYERNYKVEERSKSIEKPKALEKKPDKLNKKNEEFESNKNKLNSFRKAKNEFSQVYSYEKI